MRLEPPGFVPSADELARAVVETVRSPLVVLDDEMRVVHANPAFLQTYRLEASDTVGRSLFELGGGQWNLPELRAALRGALHEGEEVREMDFRVRLEGLGTRFLALTARRVRLGDAEQNMLLISLADETREKVLEQRVQATTNRLERSNRDLQDFAHAASHDLQEPLRKVRTYAQRLRAGLDADVLDERSNGYLMKMVEAVERMQTRIDDLLQLARVGRSSPEARPVDLGDVVGAVLDDLEIAVQEVGARVEVGPLPTLEADPSQLQILFQNLIANALKFRREGTSPFIRIGAASPSEGGDPTMHTIVVEDDGIGFEPRYAEQIFGPFQRLHGRSHYEGNGIGLALCRRIVEHHDGTILAEGAPGRGARFTITLPVARRPEHEI